MRTSGEEHDVELDRTLWPTSDGILGGFTGPTVGPDGTLVYVTAGTGRPRITTVEPNGAVHRTAAMRGNACSVFVTPLGEVWFRYRRCQRGVAVDPAGRTRVLPEIQLQSLVATARGGVWGIEVQKLRQFVVAVGKDSTPVRCHCGRLTGRTVHLLAAGVGDRLWAITGWPLGSGAHSSDVWRLDL
jgi:hypothetical protein